MENTDAVLTNISNTVDTPSSYKKYLMLFSVVILLVVALLAVNYYIKERNATRQTNKQASDVVQAITSRPSIDNTVVTNGIKAIEMKPINENDPIEKAKKLYDLATIQAMYRDDGTTFGTSSITNLKAAAELLKGTSTSQGRALLDKINLTRFNTFSVELRAGYSPDGLSRYKADVKADLSAVNDRTIKVMLKTLDTALDSRSVSMQLDRSLVGHRLYFESIIIDSFGDKITATAKKRVLQQLKQDIALYGKTTSTVLPEKPIMNDIMPDVYVLYAHSVLQKVEKIKYDNYQGDYQKIIDKIDRIVLDPVGNPRVKIMALRILKTTFENAGLSSKALTDQALTLSKVNNDATIMYQRQFGKRSSNITVKNNP
jgi:hypothetical protein